MSDSKLVEAVSMAIISTCQFDETWSCDGYYWHGTNAEEQGKAAIAAYEAHQRDKMQSLRERLLSIKLAAQTADGWKDGETFYRSIIEIINTDSIEAIAILDDLMGKKP